MIQWRQIGSTLTWVVALAIIMGAAPRVFAQPHARSVSLAEALDAAGRAPELRAWALRASAASASVDAAGGLPPTSFSVGTTSATARLVVTTSISLPIFGTLGANERVARADAAVARAEQRTASVDLRLRAASAWIELARVEERVTLLAQAAERAAQLATIARRRFEEGDAPRVDSVSAAAAAARSAAAGRAGQSEVAASSSELAGLVGWDPSQLLHAEPGLPSANDAPPLAALVASASARPSIDLATARSRSAGAQLDEASRARWPELSLEGEADIADSTLPGTDVRGMLAVALPLFSGRGAAQRAADIRHSAALAELDAERRAARAEVVAAYRRWEAAAIDVRALADEVAPAMREAETLSRRAYDEGATTLISVLDAERALAEVEAELVDARATEALARAVLDRAAGARP